MTDPDITTSPEPGRSKRRGLSLPPRGQALTRLQDLERDEPLPEPETVSTPPVAAEPAAEDTARSTAVRTAFMQEVPDAVRPESSSVEVTLPSAPRAAPRAVREPTTRITVDMPDSLHRKVSMLSVETRRSIKDLVLEALEAYYFRNPDETPR